MTLHLSVFNFMMLNKLQGDSGGPLTVEEATTKQHTLVGVVSYGDKCAIVSVFSCDLFLAENSSKVPAQH